MPTISEQFSNILMKKSEMLFHIYTPIESHVVKKNGRPIFRNKRTGMRFTGKSERLINAENFLINKLQRHAEKLEMQEPIQDDVWAIFLFHYHREEWFTKNHIRRKDLPDLSNLYCLPEDCLQKAGVLANDNLIMAHDLSRKMVSKETALEIYLLKYIPTKQSKSEDS